MLNKGLEYLNRGWSVIPIKNGSKLPLINSWKEYQERLPTEQEVRKWWEENPTANIALICGKISGVIVVDIDPKSGGTTEGLELPITLSARTGGGGQHLFYKWNKSLVGAKVGIRAGIDIRSEASYVVLPPSIHASGNHYEWMNEGEEINEPPLWLYKEEQKDKATDWDAFFAKTKGQGIRNMSATQLAGKILYEVSAEMWDTLGISFFKQWNKDYNNPSLPIKELMSVWNSIKKTHLKNNKPPEIPDASIETIEEEASIVRDFKKNKTESTFYLAKYLTQKYNIITIGEDKREIYVYKNGVYIRGENEIIYPEIQRVLGDQTTKNAKTETFHKIADMTAKPRDVFNSTPYNFIPLANGVYDLNTKELLPHDSKYRFTFQFPIFYNPNAECPLTMSFMKDILTEEQIEVIQEWIGYYFYRLYSFKKAIIFVGAGDTGKTTLLEVIINLLGKTNISNVSLQKMSSDKFAGAHLYAKHGNLVDELSAKDISDTGSFKVATGGGSISGEYKFGNQFSFLNFSKLTFACNKIPDVKDFDDEAYFGRWVVIKFNKFIEKKIPNFIQKLATEEEKSGLFNFAMIGLKRLLENGELSYRKSPMDIKLEMMSSGSSIAMFAAEKVFQKEGNEVTKESLYDEYVNFCAQKSLSTETMDMVGKKFLFYVPYASQGLMINPENLKGARVRGWRNVTLTKPEDDYGLEEEYNKM